MVQIECPECRLILEDTPERLDSAIWRILPDGSLDIVVGPFSPGSHHVLRSPWSIKALPNEANDLSEYEDLSELWHQVAGNRFVVYGDGAVGCALCPDYSGHPWVIASLDPDTPLIA